jgi:hypothetical protein
MFWSEPWDGDAAAEGCKQTWGVTPRRLWATIEWGGKAIGAASNIAFSNGLLDPWHGGGVLRDVSDSLPAIIIPEVMSVTYLWRRSAGSYLIYKMCVWLDCMYWRID